MIRALWVLFDSICMKDVCVKSGTRKNHSKDAEDTGIRRNSLMAIMQEIFRYWLQVKAEP